MSASELLEEAGHLLSCRRGLTSGTIFTFSVSFLLSSAGAPPHSLAVIYLSLDLGHTLIQVGGISRPLSLFSLTLTFTLVSKVIVSG